MMRNDRKAGLPTANLKAADNFLKVLDPQAGAFTFATYEDVILPDGTKRRCRALTHNQIHWPFSEITDRLRRLKGRGAGIFVMLNAGDGVGGADAKPGPHSGSFQSCLIESRKRPKMKSILYNRFEAADYLLHCFNIHVMPATLAKYASLGGGPVFRKAGRFPVYDEADLDEWAADLLSERVRSMSELAATDRLLPDNLPEAGAVEKSRRSKRWCSSELGGTKALHALSKTPAGP